MSRVDDEKQRQEFWRKMGEEIGEDVVDHALLRVLASEPEDLKDKWLLFFSSATCLYYKRFPNDSAMARLFNMGSPREEDYPVEGRRWDDIRCLRKGNGGFFSRLMGSPAAVELIWGEGERFLLEIDRAGEALFAGRLEDA